MTNPSAPDVHGASIVLLGSFNPAIFHPAWFHRHGLVSDEEHDAASIQVILPDFARFSFGWLDVTVTLDRFEVSSAEPENFNLLRDIVIGTFRILQHTPIRAIGVNRNQHYKLPEDRWHEIGDALVPKDVWTGVLEAPGLRTLIVEGVRPDDYEGYIRANIEPSIRVSPGIYIAVNDHFQLQDEQSKDSEVLDSGQAVAVLESQWDSILERVPQIVDTVLKVKAT
jgi:hypothetical protein